MTRLEIRFRRYHDVFNVQLQKRFYNCYKIDVIRENELLVSSILDSGNGTIYSEKQLSFQLKDRSSFFSSDYLSDLFFNGELVCSYSIINPMRNLLSFKRQKREIQFNDGRIVSFHPSPSKFSFKEHKVSYDLLENGNFFGRISALRKYTYLKFENEFDYKGEIHLEEHYSTVELILFLHFVLLDCLFLEKRHSD